MPLPVENDPCLEADLASHLDAAGDNVARANRCKRDHLPWCRLKLIDQLVVDARDRDGRRADRCKLTEQRAGRSFQEGRRMSVDAEVGGELADFRGIEVVGSGKCKDNQSLVPQTIGAPGKKLAEREGLRILIRPPVQLSKDNPARFIDRVLDIYILAGSRQSRLKIPKSIALHIARHDLSRGIRPIQLEDDLLQGL